MDILETAIKITLVVIALYLGGALAVILVVLPFIFFKRDDDSESLDT